MAPNSPSPHPSVEFELDRKYCAIFSNGSFAFALVSSNFEPHAISSPHINATFGSVSYLQKAKCSLLLSSTGGDSFFYRIQIDMLTWCCSFPTVWKYSGEMLFLPHCPVALSICKWWTGANTTNNRHRLIASDRSTPVLDPNVHIRCATLANGIFWLLLRKQKKNNFGILRNRISKKSTSYPNSGNNWMWSLPRGLTHSAGVLCTSRLHLV